MGHEKDIVLFSGGMDSFILWYHLKYHGSNPLCVYAALGHRYAETELCAVRTIEDLTSMRVSVDHSLNLGLWEEPDANIPMRNAFLAMIGAIHGNKIYGNSCKMNIHLVCQLGEQSVPDRSPAFFKEITRLLALLYPLQEGIEIANLFHDQTKGQMVATYLKEGGDPNTLQLTVGCFSGKSYPQHCGECPACFRRWVALKINDIEPNNYRKRIEDWSGLKDYVAKCIRGEYIPERVAEIRKAIVEAKGGAFWALK